MPKFLSVHAVSPAGSVSPITGAICPKVFVKLRRDLMVAAGGLHNEQAIRPQHLLQRLQIGDGRHDFDDLADAVALG
ncbi:MAG: hypothetical protein MZV65_22305 [Chromatiales bacterium]|nr:hypothetical protein [Chromatiales bacterium]